MPAFRRDPEVAVVGAAVSITSDTITPTPLLLLYMSLNFLYQPLSKAS